MENSSEFFVNIHWSFHKNSFISNHKKVDLASEFFIDIHWSFQKNTFISNHIKVDLASLVEVNQANISLVVPFLVQLTRCLKILNRNLIFWFLLDRWLECLLKKHEELIPTVSKTQVMVDLYWKCYAYGDGLKPHIEFLDGIMLSSTRDIAPSCVENVDELIERQVRSMMRGWPMDIFEGKQHRSASGWMKFKMTKN